MSDELLGNTDIHKCLCCGQRVEKPGKRLDEARCEHAFAVLTWGRRTWHVLGHRLVWALSTGAWPVNEVDHRDGVRTNNRPANLREATGSEQQHNRGLSKRSSTGLPGVSWHRGARKRRASICAQTRQVHLGLFDRAEEAHGAYLNAKRRLHPFQPEPRA